MLRLKPDQRDFSRALRNQATDAERALWQRLRARQLLGARFRRQHPIGPYVADFACMDARLVIEVDGGQHADSAHDRQRDAWLAAQGWRVLRFWDNDVLTNIEGVLAQVIEALQLAQDGARAALSPPPLPSPWQGEGE
jgi:very-short-patch-repair endonuclease